MRNTWVCLTVAALAMTAAPTTTRGADADVAVVVNPTTGSVSLRNDTTSTINIDGYLFTAALGVFDPGDTAWSSLEDQSVAGWLQGQGTTSILSETNLNTSLSITAGGAVSLGSPYEVFTPTAFGEAESTFNFTYSVEGAGVFAGEVEFVVDNNLVLVVNPTTGAASLVNQSPFDVNIDSYLIQSPEGVLDSAGWTTLDTDRNVLTGTSWEATDNSATRIGEANLFGSRFLAAGGGSLDLGTPIDPGLLADESDLIVQFSVEAGTPFGGRGYFGSVLFDPPTATLGLTGDFNGDNQVDVADYTVWRDGLGTIYTIDDYLDWRDNFGASAGAASLATTSAPEPGALSLVLAGMGLAAGARRSERRRG